MVDVRVNFDNATVILTGHANAPRNEDGRDMVCCMVSTLAQTLAATCLELPGTLVDYDAEPGNVHMKVHRSGSQMQPVAERFRMFLDGMTMLQKTYPECIRIV